MIRVTVEIVPYGQEDMKKTVGLIEIGNDGTGDGETGNYRCVIKKTTPFQGALKAKWKDMVVNGLEEDKDIIAGKVVGFKRKTLGVYDLLYRSLKACGMDRRNK